MTSGVELLAREARSLVQRLRVWTPTRWAATCLDTGPGPLSRADVAHHLAQALADAAGEAPVRLPRLESDLALPDQLAVTAHDLVQQDPPDDLARRATAHLLLHRRDLLADDVPPGLAESLGYADVLAEGARACTLWTADSPPTRR